MKHARLLRYVTPGAGAALALGGSFALFAAPAGASTDGLAPSASPASSAAAAAKPACIAKPDPSYSAKSANGSVHKGFEVTDTTVTIHLRTNGCSADVVMNENYKSMPTSGGGPHVKQVRGTITGTGSLSLPLPPATSGADCWAFAQYDVKYWHTDTHIANTVQSTVGGTNCTTPATTPPTTPPSTPPTTPPTTTPSTPTPTTSVLGTKHTRKPPSDAPSTPPRVEVLGEQHHRVLHPAAPGGAATDQGNGSQQRDFALIAIGGLLIAVGSGSWLALKRRA